MKPQQERFCQLMAAGRHTQAGAAEEAGYKIKNARRQATKMMSKAHIKSRVAELRESHDKACDIDAKYLRGVLLGVIKKSSVVDERGKYDSAGVNKAVDQLTKMGGYYEKDNQQNQSRVEVNYYAPKKDLDK